jgi:hypothetical protein
MQEFHSWSIGLLCSVEFSWISQQWRRVELHNTD